MLFFKKQFSKWQINSILLCFTYTFQIAVHSLTKEVSRNTKSILACTHLQINNHIHKKYCSEIFIFGWCGRKLNKRSKTNKRMKNQTWIWKHIVYNHWRYRPSSLCDNYDHIRNEWKVIPTGESNWNICPFGSVGHPDSMKQSPLVASDFPFPSLQFSLDPRNKIIMKYQIILYECILLIVACVREYTYEGFPSEYSHSGLRYARHRVKEPLAIEKAHLTLVR